MTRVLWTGDGTLPSGESIEAHAFELGFSEAMDPASMTNVTATLTTEGGSAVDLSVTLGPDGRSAILTGADLAAGSNYALHFEGLRDLSGNLLQPEDRMLNLADPESFEVIADTSAPVLLAVMDGSDGIYLLFDEAVVGSGDLTAAVTLTRQGVAVEGETTRVDAEVLKWTPTEATTWLLGAQYGLAGIDVEDLAGNAATVSSMAFAHLTNEADQLLIARQAPTDSYPMAASAYGVTTLFQGRTWHSDLGMYYYRARWYLPDGGVFGERDPVLGNGRAENPVVEASVRKDNRHRGTGRDESGRVSVQSWNRYSYVQDNPINAFDPTGSIRVFAIRTGPTNGKDGGYRYRIKFDTWSEAVKDWVKEKIKHKIFTWMVGPGPGGTVLYKIGKEIGKEGNKVFQGGGWVGIRAEDAKGFKYRFKGRLTSRRLEAKIEDAFYESVTKAREYPEDLLVFRRLEYSVNKVIDSLDPTAFSVEDRRFLKRIYNMEVLKNAAHQEANVMPGADNRRDTWDEYSGLVDIDS